MPTAEEKLAQEYRDAGVEVPELEAKEGEDDKKEVEKPAEVVTETPKPDDSKIEKPQEEEKEEEKSTLTEEPKEERKPRSIYDEYKDKKAELKSERELREQAEKDRDDALAKLKAVEEAKTPEQKQIATDDLEKFAEEIQADPVALKKMRDLFTKDLEGKGLSEEDRKVLEDAKAITAAHSKLAEKEAFENEYKAVAPSLKTLFPNASDEEMTAVKEKLDKLSHNKDFFDKELDYVIYKSKDELAKLVSPKKRGMEGKEKKDVADIQTTFDPNADYSKMTPVEREAWEANYAKLGKNEGLATDANGRKIII